MVALELVWGPDDEDEVKAVVDDVETLFNVSFPSVGLATACLSVSNWEQGDPIATFLVVDLGNKPPSFLLDAMQQVLIALELEEDIDILDRSDREDRVERT